jgi:hypothetical protein
VAIKAECEENSGGDQFDAFCALLVPTTFLAFDRRGQRVYMDVWAPHAGGRCYAGLLCRCSRLGGAAN